MPRYQKEYTDERGRVVPSSRFSKLEKDIDYTARKLFKKAEKLESALLEFKCEAFDLASDLLTRTLEENAVDPGQRKGNYTFYSIDRSIKIEVKVSDRIVFDDMLIKACQEKLMSFVSKNLVNADPMFSEMIMNAFTTARGKLDTRKVLDLLRYRGKTDYTEYEEAMVILEKSIRRPDSRTYMKVWKQNPTDNSYVPVDLNFSSIGFR